ncbi:hypothetical protein GCWU000325_01988 [Alloprevotella tannerae ATCC 51259]|uniref:Transposase InsH N-terminal domain-containing protein n=1 Tax=Alloprevotella tannerae ATCC 51259 TaxID=626522 RepID=C9LID0_9BACT|nr:hypothetical protein GCWU000325_01988 [Alloprevotella tannerae ATCC 51259]
MAYQSKNTDEHVTFADALLSKRYRKAQNDFLNQVDTLIDWRPIRTLINKKYTKRQNAIGAPAYDVILLFKMLLLETWYNLSDCALEERINDSITFSRFLGLKMEEVSPDHSTISRFRSALTELGLMDKLLAQFNKQLSRHHISVKGRGGLSMQALWRRHINPTEALRLKLQTTEKTIGARRKKRQRRIIKNRLSVNVKGRMKKPVGFTNKSVITTDTKSIV